MKVLGKAKPGGIRQCDGGLTGNGRRGIQQAAVPDSIIHCLCWELVSFTEKY